MPSVRRSGGEFAAILAPRCPVLVLLACSVIVGAPWHWGLRLNGSRSAPRGLYRTLPVTLSRGSFVIVYLPPVVARFARARDSLGPGDCPGGAQEAIKQVNALPEDLLDVTPGEVRLNDRRLPNSAMAAVDSAGRALLHVLWGPHWVAPHPVPDHGCRGEYAARWIPVLAEGGFSPTPLLYVTG